MDNHKKKSWLPPECYTTATIVKPAVAKDAQGNLKKKIGRNEPCPCGSKYPNGTPVKFKNCHGKAHVAPTPRREPDPDLEVRRHRAAKARLAMTALGGIAVLPVDDATVQAVGEQTEAPAPQQHVAMAMLRAGVQKRIIWAYLETGLFLTDVNKDAHTEEDRQRWNQALTDYDNLPPDQQEIFLVEQTPAGDRVLGPAEA